MPMRVAFILQRFPALSETFILNQVTGLIDAGIDLDIYAWSAGDNAVEHPEIEAYDLLARTRYIQPDATVPARIASTVSRVVRRGGWRRPDVLLKSLFARQYGRSMSSLSLIHTVASFLQRPAYDIVHCQFGYLGPLATTLGEIGALTGRVVVSFRGADLTARDYGSTYDTLFRLGDRFLPVSAGFRDKLVSMGCDASKVQVHRSGIDLSKFPYAERRRESDEPTRLITIARFVEKKGIAYGIQAVARLKASGRRVSYSIMGVGPLRSDLVRLVEELQVEDVVRFIPPQSHEGAREVLGRSHILLQPSVTAANGDQEGIPNVLKEAMAMGLPVVSTLHSGIPELVEDGVTGWLVPERDVEALRERLSYLIVHPEVWPEMGRAGRAKVEAEYDSDKLNARLVALYRELLAERGVSASSPTQHE